MAISAKFEADFSQFVQAAEKANGSLTAIQKSSSQLVEATNSWSAALSVAGGALAALGIQATLSTVVNFGKALFDDANALEKLSDMTGISEEGLQRMRIAGNDADVALEAMTRSVTMLQKRLGGDDQSANRALLDFGINIEQFKQLDAAHQMEALSVGVQNMRDPLRVASNLAALFGRSWAEILPVLKRGFKEVADNTTVMSSESVKALDDFGDAAGRFWLKTKAAFGEALADVLTMSLSDLRQLNSELKNLPAPPDASKFANFWGAVVPAGLPKDLDEITAKLDEQIKAQIKTSEAMVELNSVGAGWKGTLDTINGSVAQAVKYYLDAGVAQDKLATVYGLTAAQIKAVASELAEEQKALKLQAAATEEVTKLWDEFNQMASKGGKAFDDQIAEIDRWALDLEAKAQKAGTDTAAFYEALTALWNAKLHAASQATVQAVQETTDAGRSMFAEMNDAVMGITSEFDGWNDAIMNVKKSLDGTIQSAEDLQKARDKGNALDVGHAARDPEIMALLHQGWSLENAESIKLGRQWGFSPKLYDALGNLETTPSKEERVPCSLEGGPTGSGGLSMLDPGEYVVPKGGALVKGGGASVVNHIYVNGTAADVARQVAAEILRTMKQGGARPS